MSRSIRRDPDEWAKIDGMDKALIGNIVQSYMNKISDARNFVEQLPTTQLGKLFLEKGVPVQPDTTRLADYEIHTAKRAGHWPTSPAIAHDMLAERHGIDWDRTPHKIVNPNLPYPASTMERFAGMSRENFNTATTMVYHTERIVKEHQLLVDKTQKLTR